MTKPDPAGAKSLEEILASIRRSLAEETSERPTEPRLAPARVAQPQPKPAAPAHAAANSAGPLSGNLAGALNGSASAPALDDDLSELLTPAAKKQPAPSAPVETAKPSETGNGDAKDPLWFLSRLSAAAAGTSQAGSAARARDAAKAAPSEEEAVKLSRPETLRKTLPPLLDRKSVV